MQRGVLYQAIVVLVASVLVVLALPAGPAAAVDPAAGEYVPLTQARVVNAAFTAGQSQSFTLSGSGGVPSSGVSAVVVTVTAVTPSVNSFLTVWPSGESRPGVSQLSLASGRNVANTVIAKLGTGGKVDVYNNAGTTTVVMDVQGYFTDNTVTTAGGTFVPLSPTRIVNTQGGVGSPATAMTGGETRAFTVLGVGGVPASGVSAVAVNITAVAPTASNFITAFATGTTRPGTSTLNTNAGEEVAALAQVQVGTGGQISVYVQSGSVHLLIDVQGYYLDSTQTGRDLYVPISPKRVYSNLTGMTSGSSRMVQAAGAKEVSTSNVVVPSSGVTAVVLSVTAVAPNADGFMDVFPDGTARVGASVLNYNTGQYSVTGTVIAKVGAGGRVTVYSKNGTPGLIVDVQGYFQSVPPGAPAAPAVSSSTYPSGAWTPGAVTGSFTFTASSTAVTRYLYAMDDPTFATATAAQTSNGAPATASNVKPGDGWHTLYVRAVDFANNLSPVATYSFGTTPGVTSPKADGRTQRFLRLDALAKPGYTGVTWKYRRAEADTWTNIPTTDVTVGGQPVTAWPVTVPSGTNSDAPELSWDVPRTVHGVDGTVQVQACFTINTTTDCSTVPVTVTLDGDDLGATASQTVGPGSVSLLSGNYTVSDSDVSVDSYGSDLTLSRTFNSVQPNAGPAGAPQQLTANQAEVEAGTTGFVTTNATVVAAAPAQSGTTGLKITPSGSSGTNLETFASVGADYGNGLQSGMRAGHTYTFTTWIYVSGATGISSGSRVMRAVLFHRIGTGAYQEIASNPATATDTWQQLRLRATLPAGTTEAFIRLYNGLPSNATTRSVSYDHSTLAEEGIFGPGWVASLPVDEADADWTGLTDRGSTVTVTDADGLPVTFATKTGGGYSPTGEDATGGLTLTAGTSGAGGPADFTVSDLDGNSTVFTPAATYSSAATATGPHTYRVNKVVQPGSNQATTYSYDTEGRIVQMLAPIPPGVANCTTWQAGCKALQLAYNTAGHLTAVTFRTTNASGGDLKVDVACFGYDDGTGGSGRLLTAWDPRMGGTPGSGVQPIACAPGSPTLPTTYTYNAAGRLASITPPGLAAWSLGYDSVGRLSTASRTHNSANGGGTETSSVEYDVPRTADGGNPAWRPDLSSLTAVAAWGQQDVPTMATAVFGPGDTASSTDLRDGSITYLNADGRVVNTAAYTGRGWAVTTSEYDQWGNTIRTLTAANRDIVVGNTTSPVLDAITTPDPAAKALALSTINIYTADGQDVTDSFGPYHQVTLPDGSVVGARPHTHTSYDTGAETAHPAGPLLHLPIQTTTAASLSPDTLATDLQDTRITRNDYALSTSDATGWTFRKPMRVVSDPGGVASTTVTRYDADSGLVVESRMPSETGGGGPGTTATIYYTAGSNSADAACGNKPRWVNLVCVSKPANTNPGTSGLPQLVVTRTTDYDYLNRATTVEQSAVDAGGTTRTRTTTTAYDNSGYSLRVKTTDTTGGLGAAVPATTTGYDSATGQATTVSAGGTSATTGYDDFGRITSYNDAAEATGNAANQTTTTYDNAGRTATITDAHGTITYGYNGDGDRRDHPTTMTVSGITGTFTGLYDSDGQLTSQTWPNGLREVHEFNTAGERIGMLRTRADSAWLSQVISSNIHRDIRTEAYTGAADNAGAHTYIYDGLGRLTEENDATVEGCVTQKYALIPNSNRASATTYAPAGDGGCQTTTSAGTTSYTYDAADRLIPTGDHAGLTYDAFGRITTLPAADTTAGTGNVSIGYYANDLVRTQAQDGVTLTYSLDAAGRLRSWSNSATGVTKTNHYNDGSNDSPGWISESTDHSLSTRNITDIAGNLAATINQLGVITWQITNLHGDVAATAAENASEPSTYYRADAYGIPIGDSPDRYGWLGGKQRSSETLGGLILMGVRLYAPSLGRFLQIDPVPGGSCNGYEYACADPINNQDLDGKRCRRWFSKCRINNAVRAGYNMGRSTWNYHSGQYRSGRGCYSSTSGATCRGASTYMRRVGRDLGRSIHRGANWYCRQSPFGRAFGWATLGTIGLRFGTKFLGPAGVAFSWVEVYCAVPTRYRGR